MTPSSSLQQQDTTRILVCLSHLPMKTILRVVIWSVGSGIFSFLLCQGKISIQTNCPRCSFCSNQQDTGLATESVLCQHVTPQTLQVHQHSCHFLRCFLNNIKNNGFEKFFRFKKHAWSHALRRNFAVSTNLSCLPTPRQKPSRKVALSTFQQFHHVQPRLMYLRQMMCPFSFPSLR